MSDILFCPQYPEIARASADSVSTEESWNVGGQLRVWRGGVSGNCGGHSGIQSLRARVESKPHPPCSTTKVGIDGV